MAAELTGRAWGPVSAPSLDDFEALALQALEGLPEPFLSMVAGVPCSVVDFPDAETLSELEAETEFDILGLFRGVGLPHGAGNPQTGQLPNQIWLYRRPILDYWAEHEETLGAVITHVLIHEIGHHFGFSDDDMEALEAQALAEGSKS